MYDDPLRIIAQAEGVFLYREAIAAGYRDHQISTKRRRGEWHRVRHGAYCFGDVWATLSPEERHLLRAHAVRRTTPGPVAFSHITSLVAHGISVWNVDLATVHVTRLDGNVGRTLGSTRHHTGHCEDDEVTEAAGLRVTTPPRAVLESTTLLGVEEALVSVDSAIWNGHCTLEELLERFRDRYSRWPGSQRLHIVTRLATGRSQTPGESRCMYAFWRGGLPRPEQQWDVHDGSGRLVASLDFAWPEHGHFGEFDGMRKYLRDLKRSQSIEDVVIAEKRREDTVRSLTGWTCSRIMWTDLERPGLLISRLAAALDVRSRRSA
ncbi:MAG: hypothetical protein ACTHNS_11140 [Marmoricola sp.]